MKANARARRSEERNPGPIETLTQVQSHLPQLQLHLRFEVRNVQVQVIVFPVP
jgi:hypothetical protein